MEEIDITGKKYGLLTAIKKVKSRINGIQKRSFWLFRCDCGKEKEICKFTVTSGKTISCGCYQDKIRGQSSKKHNMSESRLYACWLDMKHRCYLKSNERYKNYGGRGIIVCGEWLNKENGSSNFIRWALKNGYKDNLTIDRIDVRGNYYPENCRWITIQEQAKNKTNNRRITINGTTKCLAEWCKYFGISDSTFYLRKKKGLSDEDALLIKKHLRSDK